MKFYPILICIFFLSLTACNINESVTIHAVDIHTHEVDQDTYVDFEAIIYLGNLKLSNKNISNKNHTVVTQHLEDGTNRIAFSINYTQAIQQSVKLGKSLPNERELPRLFEADTLIVEVPVLEHSRIYVGGDIEVGLYAGIALNLTAFDHILSHVPVPLNLFTPFIASANISGSGGFYTSPQMGKNGLAVFAKRIQSQPAVIRNFGSTFDPEELKKIDKLTLFRLNYLLSQRAIIRLN